MSSTLKNGHCHPGSICSGWVHVLPRSTCSSNSVIALHSVFSQGMLVEMIRFRKPVPLTYLCLTFPFSWPQVYCCLFLWLCSFAGKSSNQTVQESNTNKQVKLEGLKLLLSPRSSFLFFCGICRVLGLASPRKLWGQDHQRKRCKID